jgi:50S ribosomal protein L16 3-hydroxylase
LQHFEPTQEWLLEPGDMLYLPPQWGHDGVAEGGDCMTCSIGFRAPAAAELAREMLLRLADEPGPAGDLYRDPGQAATSTPGALPVALQAFAEAALQRQLADPLALARVLGEWLTEPKSQVWFDTQASTAASESKGPTDLALDPRTRMMYDDTHVFINGEAFRAAGRDARVMRHLADTRRLTAKARAGLGAGAAELLDDWCRAGWIREALS